MINMEIYVISHKINQMPKNNIYIPMQVGFAEENFEGFLRDNSGEDNIADKNANYCELTGLYWIWKNCKSDVVGLMHYRRLLSNGKNTVLISNEKKYDNILTADEINDALEKCDIILPKKHNYISETAKLHYINNHHEEGLNVTRNVIKQKFPDYLDYYDMVLDRRYSHLLNIMICRKDLFDSYCQWLFDILFEVEKNIDISEYSPSEARIFGYLSELLVDVYVEKNKLKYIEFPVMFMEKQNYIKRYYNSLKGKLGLNKVGK